MKDKSIREKVIGGLFWRLCERIGAQGVSFIVSIILARLLTPNDYGLIALTMIFISISNVFVQSGFGNALIQKKDADDTDFSSVFYFNVIISISLYIFIFLISPLIANFYNRNDLTHVMRLMGLSILIYGVNNIQRAYVSKTMQFKKFFYSTLVGTILSGIVGVIMAFKGFGVWALVSQYLTNTVVDTCVLWFTVKWRPKKLWSFERLKQLYSFGWKLLMSSFIDTVYNNMYDLLIGRIYNSAILGLYNKGSQFPSLIVTNINEPIQSVLLPALSQEQDDKERLKSMVRRSIVTSSFFIFPMMVGLAAIAKPLVIILLTEKWLGCVLFLQISCVTLVFWPIHTSNLQAINAIGRSDIFLKLEIIKKILSIAALIISMPFGIYVMVIGRAFVSLVCTVINAFPNKKLLGYSFVEQWKDIAPYLLLSLIMGVGVLSVELLKLNSYITLLIQIPVGVIIYFALSYILKFECLTYLLSILENKFNLPTFALNLFKIKNN
ncbi:lipopolysaccharide biosynthesis protein [Terrisporobacter sp.]